MPPLPRTPLLIAAVAIAVGSCLGSTFSVHQCHWFGAVPFALIALSCTVFRRHDSLRSAGVLAMLVSTSSLSASVLTHPGPNHIHWRLEHVDRPAGVPAFAVGLISSTVQHRDDRLIFEMELDCLVSLKACLRVEGKLRVTSSETSTTFGQGDSVRVTGVLLPLRRKRNPYDFDLASWYRSRGLSGSIVRAEVVRVVRGSDPTDRVVEGARVRVRTSITETVPTRSQDMPLALLLGDRSLIAPEVRDDFARSGLMHLLAISGLHVMFVGMVVHRLLQPLLLRFGWSWRAVELIRATITLVILIGYALVCGSNPSVVRAVTMAGFLLVAPLARSISNPLNALGGAACLILALDPAAPSQPSFQLSFSAVFGLLLMGHGLDASVLRKLTGSSARALARSVSASIVATLATGPALFFHFGYVGLAGVVFNIVAIPLGAALLCASILTVLVHLAAPGLAVAPGSAVDLLATMLKLVARIGGSPDFLVLGSDDALISGVVCILTLLAFVVPAYGGLRRPIILITLILPPLGLIQSLASDRHTPRVDVLFLDVGHGDAAIVRLPNGDGVLIDAGVRHRFVDEGTRTVIPHLKSLDLRRLRYAVVSHPHADHLGGMVSILEESLVDCVGDNGKEVGSELYRRTNELIVEGNVCHRTLSAGDTLNLHPSTRILVIAPGHADAGIDENDASIVLKILFGRTSFLFTGDIEESSERDLTTRNCHLLASDVIKVPHHGSRTSSTDPFVRCATSSLDSTRAVVSVGSPLKYGLPDEEVIARWMSVGASVHSTYEKGALWLRSNGVEITEIDWD